MIQCTRRPPPGNLEQIQPTLCSMQKGTSSSLRRVLTFRHVFTLLRICTYAQLPQARKTRQTCREACPALEQKPYRKSASVSDRMVFSIFPAFRTPHQTKAAPALRSAAHPSTPSASRSRPTPQGVTAIPKAVTKPRTKNAHRHPACAQRTSRIIGRSYPRAGGNHMGATLEFPVKPRLEDMLFLEKVR